MTQARREPIVLVDMDGVLADFEAGFWDRWSTRWPDAPDRAAADRSRFYVDDQVPTRWRAAARDLVTEAGFFRDLPVMAGAASAMAAMLERGWNVRICTAPILDNPTCTSDKLAWAAEHLGAAWAERVIITKDKTLARGDVLVDDRPDITGALEPTWQHVVFDATYNGNVPSASGRLHHWSQWAAVLEPLLPARAGAPAHIAANVPARVA